MCSPILLIITKDVFKQGGEKNYRAYEKIKNDRSAAQNQRHQCEKKLKYQIQISL